MSFRSPDANVYFPVSNGYANCFRSRAFLFPCAGATIKWATNLFWFIVIIELLLLLMEKVCSGARNQNIITLFILSFLTSVALDINIYNDSWRENGIFSQIVLEHNTMITKTLFGSRYGDPNLRIFRSDIISPFNRINREYHIHSAFCMHSSQRLSLFWMRAENCRHCSWILAFAGDNFENFNTHWKWSRMVWAIEYGT